MKGMSSLDFVRAWWRPTGLGAALAVVAAAMAALVTVNSLSLADIQGEVENIEHRIDQRKRANEADQLRQKRLSPEDRRIERMLEEQEVEKTGSGLAVVDWIEGAWTPEIALGQIVVEKAGRYARIEGAAARLSQVYQFVERMHGYRPERKTSVLEHHSVMEQGQKIVRFTLGIEKL